MTLEQAMSHLNLRKQNMDHIIDDPRRDAERRIREDELDRTLELLREVQPAMPGGFRF